MIKVDLTTQNKSYTAEKEFAVVKTNETNFKVPYPENLSLV